MRNRETILGKKWIFLASSFLLPLSPPSLPSFSMKKPFCRLAGLIDSVWFHKLDSISEHLSDADLSEASFQCHYPSDPVMCAHVFKMVGERICTCICGLESVVCWFNDQLFSWSWGNRRVGGRKTLISNVWQILWCQYFYHGQLQGYFFPLHFSKAI